MNENGVMTGAREAFCAILQSAGAQVRAAGSAREGLEILTQFPPHILVSDIAMPDEDGYSFIRKIRNLENQEIRGIPAAGFNLHISKPVDVDNFIDAIVEFVKVKA